jgi:hypothetical protein
MVTGPPIAVFPPRPRGAWGTPRRSSFPFLTGAAWTDMPIAPPPPPHLTWPDAATGAPSDAALGRHQTPPPPPRVARRGPDAATARNLSRCRCPPPSTSMNRGRTSHATKSNVTQAKAGKRANPKFEEGEGAREASSEGGEQQGRQEAREAGSKGSSEQGGMRVTIFFFKFPRLVEFLYFDIQSTGQKGFLGGHRASLAGGGLEAWGAATGATATNATPPHPRRGPFTSAYDLVFTA